MVVSWRLLEGVGANHAPRHLSHDGDHGDGVEQRASASVKTWLVAPGSEVATQTPTRPEERAKLEAAKASPCSWRKRWLAVTGERVIVPGGSPWMRHRGR